MRPASPVVKPRDTLREHQSAATQPKRENLQVAIFGLRELFLQISFWAIPVPIAAAFCTP